MKSVTHAFNFSEKPCYLFENYVIFYNGGFFFQNLFYSTDCPQNSIGFSAAIAFEIVVQSEYILSHLIQ